jgi:hypothetical protein
MLNAFLKSISMASLAGARFADSLRRGEGLADSFSDAFPPRSPPIDVMDILPTLIANAATALFESIVRHDAEAAVVRKCLDGHSASIERLIRAAPYLSNVVTDISARVNSLHTRLDKLEDFTGFRQPDPRKVNIPF